MSTNVWDYRQDLEQLASYLCRHRQDAEDVAQDALIKAADNVEGFRSESSVRTWLHTIATNECRMLRRKRQPSSLDEILDQVAFAAEPVSLDADPEELALELETRHEVLVALRQMPPNYRRALILKDGKEMSLEEIADNMETTVPAVKSMLYRARREMRKVLPDS